MTLIRASRRNRERLGALSSKITSGRQILFSYVQVAVKQRRFTPYCNVLAMPVSQICSVGSHHVATCHVLSLQEVPETEHVSRRCVEVPGSCTRSKSLYNWRRKHMQLIIVRAFREGWVGGVSNIRALGDWGERRTWPKPILARARRLPFGVLFFLC